MNTHPDVVKELKSGWSADCPYLGKGKHYPDFLKFFQDEIEEKGWEKVLLEYVFKGDERSEAIYGRLFAGMLPNDLPLPIWQVSTQDDANMTPIQASYTPLFNSCTALNGTNPPS